MLEEYSLAAVMDDSQIAHLMLPDEHSYQPNFLQGEQLLHYGSVVQLNGRHQQLFSNRSSLMTASSERHDASDVSIGFLQLPAAGGSGIPITDAAHSVPGRFVAKVKKPTGSTAARLLAEQYSKNRSSHASQTDSPTTVAVTRPNDRHSRSRQRLPPKKDSCLLCNAEVPENQRDRHVLRHHLKKPVYRCPLCAFVSIAEPSIVRTHLRLKHREFDLAAVNCRQEFAEELAILTRQCFGPKKRFIRQTATDESGSVLTIRSNKAKSRVRPVAVDATPIECKVCVAKTTVQSDQVKIHVAQCHLHLPYLYGCPKEGCVFGSYTCSKTVKTHIQKEHGLQTKIISEAKKNRKEIKKAVVDCFGESAWTG